ncbi:metal-sulfur cluster assembly factor [Desemzia sp. RIT804]|uniref:metal-sulfur cluster assembly factor n=1 Tax=Desemzia sp. RIT 804 TaxID=2810209 RepID=UPI00195018A4|nr:metal-sulfur cluster assembly factor [Desemzia sp. RIT 804]MBM6613697.1 metal-sulfur cluster assembly factor [Desemzia sp. RIT 804]
MSEQPTSWSVEEQERIIQNIMAALEQVIDPELGIDIVNLGLVYGVDLFEGGHCVINMTLTTMGCPLADVITEEVMNALKPISKIETSEVKLVWYPAWDTSKMSRYARIALGIRQ